LGLRAIAIKYIKANYFNFFFLIGNLLLLYVIIISKYAIFIKGPELFEFYLDWLVINIIIANILFSLIDIINNYLCNNNIFLIQLFNIKNKIFKYYLIYAIIYLICYELIHFKNLYNLNYSKLYFFLMFIYLHLIPIIIIFLYVVEKNNVINTQYLLFKDRLLLKSWLVVRTFILSFINIVAVLILSIFLIPIVFYLIYYIHILFGITPDLFNLELP
jgi:hypothetical protein